MTRSRNTQEAASLTKMTGMNLGEVRLLFLIFALPFSLFPELYCTQKCLDHGMTIFYSCSSDNQRNSVAHDQVSFNCHYVC